MTTTLTFSALNEDRVVELAQQLAPLVKEGGSIYLHGDLGAGKTTFVRALLRACGVTGRIKSPTFTLVEVYNVSRLDCYHFDFYRFNDPREWLDAGFRETITDQTLVLIEWPEKAEGTLPTPDIHLHIAHQGDLRDYQFDAPSERGKVWLTELLRHYSSTTQLCTPPDVNS